MKKLIESIEKHHPDYSYNISDYKNARSYMAFTCPFHGEFKALPTNIIRGTGCKKCSIEKLCKNKLNKTRDKLVAILDKDNILYGYTYDISDFYGYHSKILRYCPAHGGFRQSVAGIIGRKNKCPKCYDFKSKADGGINIKNILNGKIKNIKCYIIAIHISNNIIYKIGLSRNIKNRLRQIKSEVKADFIEILSIYNGTPMDLFILEQEVIKQFGSNSDIKFNGYTETIISNPTSFIKEYITNTDIQVTTEY